MKIQKLIDLLEIAISLQKQELPTGFMNTFWIDKVVREKIYIELLNNNIENEYWSIKNKLISGYQFKILGINFLILSTN